MSLKCIVRESYKETNTQKASLIKAVNLESESIIKHEFDPKMSLLYLVPF
jgi:hypothetical protein